MHRLGEKYGDIGGLAKWSKVADVELCIPALLRHVQAHFSDQPLLVFDKRTLTYGEAVERSARFARQLLGAGAGKGTRIGMIFPNSPEFIVTWLAIVRIGAVAVPISTLSKAAELVNIIRHADLHLLITADRFLSHDYIERLETGFPELAGARAPLMLREAPYLRQIWIWGSKTAPWGLPVDLSKPCAVDETALERIEAEVFPSDAVSIIYTSGSTAAPKGVIHTHGNFMRQAAKLAAILPFQSDDRVFTPMPFFWVGGLTMTLLCSMHTGCTVLGSGTTGAGLLDFLEAQKVTYLLGWPYLMKAIESDPSYPKRDFSAMRGGNLLSALPESKRPRNQTFGNSLGMTETGGPHTVSCPDYPDSLKGTFGPPMPGMEHKIVDLETGATLAEGHAGALLVRGDALMTGFVKMEREACFDKDGWYRTGDLCSFRDGHLFFHGRTDDMIKSSGANVSPREVEGALKALPGVSEAMVVAVPDAARGNVVGAVIVPEADTKLDEEEIRRSLSATLSSYKIPRVMKIMEIQELPILSSSKVDRRLLMQLLSERARS